MAFRFADLSSQNCLGQFSPSHEGQASEVRIRVSASAITRKRVREPQQLYQFAVI